MTERTFDVELIELNDQILKMGNIVESSIANCIDALQQRDESLSRKIIEDDNCIDELENEINDKCITLLAKRQPMAADLRFIATAMMIITDLERIGDLAVDIAERNIELLNWPLLKPLIDTPKLADTAKKMIKQSIDAFVNRDTSREMEFHELEEESDRLRDLITDELTDIMVKDSSSVPKAIPLLLIARHLERICDHAMNIMEDVVYMVEARVVKHFNYKGGNDLC